MQPSRSASLLVLVFLLYACSAQIPEPTLTATQVPSTATDTPTATSEPTQTPTATPFAGSGEVIAYTSNQNENREVIVQSISEPPFSFSPSNITNNPGWDGPSDWSPDGKQILIVSDRDEFFEIYRISVDGEEVVRLTNSDGYDGEANWSPDGLRVVFTSRRGGTDDIWLMNAQDGSELLQLTSFEGDEGFPVWSPDGKKIAFTSGFGTYGEEEIWIMNVDGSSMENITNNSYGDLMPDWSPDGEKIVYASYRDDQVELYTMSSDGSNQEVLLVSPESNETQPKWSPDGRWIAFSSNRNGTWLVYILSIESGEIFRISDREGSEGSPSWKPVP